MKKYLFAAISCFCLCVLLCGCSPFAKTYTYSEDYADTDAYILTSGTEVRSSDQLKEIITEMITSGTAKKDLSFMSYNGSVNEDLALVCADIRYNTPIGCYALDDLTFETSRIVSYYIATVHADYAVSPEQLASIQSITGGTALEQKLQQLYEDGVGEQVLSVEHAVASAESIQTAIHSCYLSSPLTYVHEPQVTVQSYTVGTVGGIFDIVLSCDLTEDEINADTREIRQYIRQALPADADKMEITPDALLSFARDLKDSLGEISFANSKNVSLSDVLSSSSSLDSRTAALLFHVMCSQLGIDSMVVEGYGSSMEGQEHTWNLVNLDGLWYHADLSMLDETDSQHFLISDDTMWKYCSWDTSTYPGCGADYVFVQSPSAPQEDTVSEDGPEENTDTEEQPDAGTKLPE